MKKTLYQIFALSLALLPIFSCVKENGKDGIKEEGIKITLNCDDISTKADVAGTGTENLIKTVDYFIFHADGSGAPTGEYTYRGTHKANLESNCTFYIEQATFADKTNYVVFSIVNYPSGRDKTVDFGPEVHAGTPGSTKTYDELQQLLVSEKETDAATGEIAAKTFTADESSRTFIMTGLSSSFLVDSDRTGNIKGEASVNLTRLAAKVDMVFYVLNSLTVDKDGGKTREVWTPMIDGGNIRLSLNNAVEDAYMGGADIGSSVSYFNYSPNYDNTVGAETTRGGKSYTTMTSAPFYTYPKAWSMGDDQEPFLKLIIPWKLTKTVNIGDPTERTTTSQKELYYKIVLPKEMSGTGFESNNWYRLELNVSQLGSDSDIPEFDLTCGYKVVKWQSDPSFVIAKLVQGMYLDVSNGEVQTDGSVHYTMFSDPIEIPYIAANGGVSANDKTMTFTKFGSFPAEEWRLSSSGWARVSGSGGTSGRTETASDLANIIYVDEDSEVIRITHTLDSDYNGSTFDVAPFTFTFTLHLNNDTGTTYDKDIVITQYPPLYIEVNPNGNSKSDGWVRVKRIANDHSGETNTDVFDDSGNSDGGYSVRTISSANYYIGRVTNYKNVGDGKPTGNYNPNLYKVCASILDLTMTIDGVSDVNMVLGDSREATSSYASNQLKGNDNNPIPGVLNGLSGYRKTAEDKKNFVSPAFIIASSYGKTHGVSYEGALKRCAVYQEDGYPAGRWRLPTMAEIEFVIKLSDKGKIPQLFSIAHQSSYNSGYWAAGKEIFTYVGNTLSETEGFVNLAGKSPTTWDTGAAHFVYTTDDTYKYAGSVRCVYDTWYWGDQPDAAYTTPGTDLGYKTTRE